MKVLFFYANWCQSSNKMYPSMVSLSKRFEKSRFSFEFVNVDTKEGANLSVKHEVRNVPVVLITDKHGKEIERLKGLTEYEMLVESLRKYMK